MPLSRAEIQKRYRERKKREEGDAYLARERARQKVNYIPVSELSRSDKAKRKASVNNRVKKCRANKKGATSTNTTSTSVEVTPVASTSGVSRSHVSETSEDRPTPLVVKLPTYSAKMKAPKHRQRKRLDRVNKMLNRVIRRHIETKRKLKSLQKQIQRRQTNSSSHDTPKTKTERLLKAAFIVKNKSNAENVRRQLFLGNVLIKNIKQKGIKNKRSMYSAAAGEIVKKYKVIPD